MVGFSEMSFPAVLAFGSGGGPKFSTQVVEGKNGFEQRNVHWSAPRMVFNAVSAIKNKADYELLRDFFYIQQGKARGFRFKDWADYQAEGQALNIADGAETEFQLRKRYSSGVYEWFRVVKKPVAGTVDVYADGVLQTAGVTVDNTSGLVVFDAAPANGVVISADFEFDVPVRFDVDHLEVRFESKNTLKMADIPMVEVML